MDLFAQHYFLLRSASAIFSISAILVHCDLLLAIWSFQVLALNSARPILESLLKDYVTGILKDSWLFFSDQSCEHWGCQELCEESLCASRKNNETRRHTYIHTQRQTWRHLSTWVLGSGMAKVFHKGCSKLFDQVFLYAKSSQRWFSVTSSQKCPNQCIMTDNHCQIIAK